MKQGARDVTLRISTRLRQVLELMPHAAIWYANGKKFPYLPHPCNKQFFGRPCLAGPKCACMHFVFSRSADGTREEEREEEERSALRQRVQ